MFVCSDHNEAEWFAMFVYSDRNAAEWFAMFVYSDRNAVGWFPMFACSDQNAAGWFAMFVWLRAFTSGHVLARFLQKIYVDRKTYKCSGLHHTSTLGLFSTAG